VLPENVIDRAAKIIEREEVGRGKRERQRRAIAPLFETAHFRSQLSRV